MSHSHDRVGPWLHSVLKSYGVDTVFGIPGVHTIPMYAGLKESGLRHVTPRHEQGAGFMADGYARVTGKPGVCFIITGPGMTNILTAMGQAYADSIPMLVISSVSKRAHLGQGRGFLHELPNQQAMVSGVSAFSHTLHELADLPTVLDRAFSVFNSARPRPIHIEIPLDLWDHDVPDSASSQVRDTPPQFMPVEEDLTAAAALLSNSEKPLIVAGGGARSASEDLQVLAEKLAAPVVMTINGRGLLSPDHPLRLSASGSSEAVRHLINESDVVLAVGTELGPTDFDIYDTGELPDFAKLIRVDVEAEQLYRNVTPHVPLLGAAKSTLRALSSAIAEIASPQALAEGCGRANVARMSARAELSTDMEQAVIFLEKLRAAAPQARIIGDSTQPIYAGNLYYDAAAPTTWFNSSVGFGTLGYALPAATGAALGDPDAPVICLIGDGGLQFTLGELASLRESGANTTVIVWNNNSYGEIKNAMVGAEVSTVGVDLFTPDFLGLAKAFDFECARIAKNDDFEALIKTAVESEKPFFIQVDD